ncbi:hypothetical protein GTB64_004438 [Salmonella enterica]|nr:hypothetical protein [Salmonella enterica]
MANEENVRAGGSEDTSKLVVFTGKLPEAIKTRLKVAAARSGRKQQDILAEAVLSFLDVKGF